MANLFQRAVARTLMTVIGKETFSSMVQFFDGTNRRTAPMRGTRELLAAYSQLPWLRAVVNKVSRNVGSTTWTAYVERKNGKAIRDVGLQKAPLEIRKAKIKKLLKQGDIEEIESHPILDLLNAGNSFHVGIVNGQIIQMHIDLVGESFIIKERNGLNMPNMLWPIPPHWVAEIPKPDAPYFEIRYGSLQIKVPIEEMIWISDPNPMDPYGRGTGMARALADELETDEYAAKHTKNWFYNRARPDLIIAAKGLSQPDTARLEQDWVSKHQGFLKAYKPHFLNKDITIHELNQTFQSMQLTELRKYERDTIIQVYGAPPEIFGIIESSNRATIDAADFLFAKWLVVPRLELQRANYQERLVPDFDNRIILDYESPITEDKEFNLNAMKAAPWAHQADEWREIAGSEELANDDGKIFMVPFNVFPTSSLSESGNDGNGADTTVEDDDLEEEEEVETSPSDINQKIIKQESREAFIARILGSLRSQFMIDRLVPVIRDTVSEFGIRSFDNMDIDFDFNIAEPRVTEFLQTRSVNRVKNLIDKSTKTRLRNTLSQGVDQGETIESLSNRVTSVFADASSRRARVIARTETVRAANFATNESYVQARVPGKEWLSSRDQVVRDSHQPGIGLDGQIVPVAGNFTSPASGATGPHPGELGLASEDVNCRCTTTPVFEDEFRAALSEEQKTTLWKAFEADRKVFERKMLRAARRGFNDQEKQVLAELLKEV